MPVPSEFERSKFAADFFEEDPEQVARLEAHKRVNPRDRMSQVNERLNQKETCDTCGSQWFEEVTFQQYRGDQYGSTPGASIEAISPMPMTILRCLCGKLMTPNVGGAIHGGRTPNENMTSFDGSLRAAINYQSQEPRKVLESVIGDAMQAVASQEDIAAVTSKLAVLEMSIASLVPQTEAQTYTDGGTYTPAAAEQQVPSKKKR